MASLIKDSTVASPLEPTVQNILDNRSIKWIFVGGKGGTGKTTCSCCIAILLAEVRESVLLISTDPAHNISDAFDQKFKSTPTQVVGINNLFAMEIDTNFSFFTNTNDDSNSFLNDVLSTLPGIDEVMAHMNVMHLIKSMEYSVVVFDTAATGHTTQLLQLPNLLENFFERAVSLKRRFGSVIDQMSIFFGFTQNNGIPALTENKFSDILDELRSIRTKFREANHTTFVCVCLADNFSINETSRFVRELKKLSINIDNIVVNQLLLDKSNSENCRFCKNRKDMQKRFLAMIFEQYRHNHITLLPLLDHELKPDELRSFSKLLIKPYQH